MDGAHATEQTGNQPISPELINHRRALGARIVNRGQDALEAAPVQIEQSLDQLAHLPAERESGTLSKAAIRLLHPAELSLKFLST